MPDTTTPSHADEDSSLTPVQKAQLNSIMNILRHQLPVVEAGTIISEQLIKQVQAVVLKNIPQILSAALAAGGLSVLLPALTISIVNAVGFTASGVAAGSLAAAFQSVVYGGLTGGIFSSLQSFGATAVIAPPLALTIAGAAVALGGGCLAYQAFKSKQSPSTLADKGPNTDRVQDEDDGHGRRDLDALKETVAVRDMDAERMNPAESAPTSAADVGAMEAVKGPPMSAYYHSVAARIIVNTATEHLQAAGNGALGAFSAVGQHSTSAMFTTIDAFRGLRKRARPEAPGQHP